MARPGRAIIWLLMIFLLVIVPVTLLAQEEIEKTPTPTVTLTATASPTATSTVTATATNTVTSSATATATDIATSTDAPTETVTDLPALTATLITSEIPTYTIENTRSSVFGSTSTTTNTGFQVEPLGLPISYQLNFDGTASTGFTIIPEANYQITGNFHPDVDFGKLIYGNDYAAVAQYLGPATTTTPITMRVAVEINLPGSATTTYDVTSFFVQLGNSIGIVQNDTAEFMDEELIMYGPDNPTSLLYHSTCAFPLQSGGCTKIVQVESPSELNMAERVNRIVYSLTIRPEFAPSDYSSVALGIDDIVIYANQNMDLPTSTPNPTATPTLISTNTPIATVTPVPTNPPTPQYKYDTLNVGTTTWSAAELVAIATGVDKVGQALLTVSNNPTNRQDVFNRAFVDGSTIDYILFVRDNSITNTTAGSAHDVTISYTDNGNNYTVTYPDINNGNCKAFDAGLVNGTPRPRAIICNGYLLDQLNGAATEQTIVHELGHLFDYRTQNQLTATILCWWFRAGFMS